MLYPNINAERSRKGLTIENFAKELGVSRKTIYNWMAHGNIPQSKLKMMAEMFECSIDYLLGITPTNKAGSWGRLERG